ncbi:hypothetical protein ACLB2K_073553 [Fragaria x ananassa]
MDVTTLFYAYILRAPQLSISQYTRHNPPLLHVTITHCNESHCTSPPPQFLLPHNLNPKLATCSSATHSHAHHLFDVFPQNPHPPPFPRPIPQQALHPSQAPHNTPISLTPLANDTLLLDSFVVTQALIEAVNAGRFRNVRLSFMNIMSWQDAVGDLEVVLRTMVEEGALPNCRTYTVMIEHMVKCGKLEAAMEVFKVLPFMRVKRSLRQYEVLVEALLGARQFEEIKALLEEMRAMRLSLERM